MAVTPADLENSPDLRRLYDAARDSSDPLQRHLARRAWAACFPVFIPPAGGRPSVDTFLNALPSGMPDGDLRANAYRSLFRRCEGFMTLPREQIMAQTRRLTEEAELGHGLAPGEDALRVLLAGDVGQGLLLARRAVASQDAYAVGSLREFMYRYTGQLLDTGKLPANDRPDLRSLAFALAACQMGVDCGPQSLTALQMCANAAQCTGSVADRLLQNLGSDIDREAALSEARRVAQAVRTGDMAALALNPR